MANLITLLRTLLGLLVAYLLFLPDVQIYWWAFALTILAIFMDGLDGYVARKFNEASKAGAVIDIIGDRIVEQVYWIVFLALGWVPLWIALTVVIRGVLVDGLRSIALEKGFTAFGSSSMMQSPIGVLLVSSRFSRWSYAVFKGFAFSLMIWANMPGDGVWGQQTVTVAATLCMYATVFFCVVRGLPVILEARRFLKAEA